MNVYIVYRRVSHHFFLLLSAQGPAGEKGEQGPAGPPGFQVGLEAAPAA